MITEEQRILRKSGIGGSDIGAIMGLSKYQTALDIYKQKTGMTEDIEETPAIEWGNRLERVVIEKFDEQHPEYEVEISPETVIDGWKIANLDGLIYKNGVAEGVLEIKTASAHSTEWDNGVPEYYVAQVQWYMGLCHLDYAYVACLKGGNDYKEYLIQRNDEFIDRAVQAGEHFWNNLQLGIAPDPVNVAEAVSIFSDSNEGEEVVVGSDVSEDLDALIHIKKEIERLKEQEDSIKTNLMIAMGSAEIAKDQHGKVVATWKTSKTTRFNQTAFKQAEPGLYEAFKTESKYRTLRIK